MGRKRREANRPLTRKALGGLRRLVEQVEAVPWTKINSTAEERGEGGECGNDVQLAGL